MGHCVLAKQKLTMRESLSGILNWCIEGLDLLNAEGFTIPQSVHEATRDYNESSDKAGQFVTEFLSADPGGLVKANDVHRAYQDWCFTNGFRPEGFSEFKKSLASAGIMVERKRPKGSSSDVKKVQMVVGYKLNAP